VVELGSRRAGRAGLTDGVRPPLGAPAHVDAGRLRPAWAEIDLDAIRHNASVLRALAVPAGLCAVVKAAGYGHGAVPVAAAALAGGASHLAVALVEEGRQLREAGLSAPVNILSQPVPAAMPEVVACELTPALYTRDGVEALVDAVRASGRQAPLAVHVKVDTGMHRVGAAPADALDLAAAVAGHPELDLEGVFTHLAVADELDDPYTDIQLDSFDGVVANLAAAGIRPRLLHAANSAGAIFHPRARYDLVRCGIALYGLAPAADQVPHPSIAALRPAMSLKARVSHVKEVDAGERLSYGLRYRLEHRSVVATVPVGYADGVTRRLSSEGGAVLIRGRRRSLAGTVTMDQILVDCGPGSDVSVGDEVVLIGTQGDETVSAWEWAERTGTIAYEVVCGLSGRVPRTYGS
jgi:alanine racemase